MEDLQPRVGERAAKSRISSSHKTSVPFDDALESGKSRLGTATMKLAHYAYYAAVPTVHSALQPLFLPADTTKPSLGETVLYTQPSPTAQHHHHLHPLVHLIPS